MRGRKGFVEFIKEFRANGRIPIVWSIADIRPLLKGIFPENTISVFPNNYSASPDGRIKGDAVKRGMKPRFFRVGRGLFILVEEFDGWKSGHVSSVAYPPQEQDIPKDAEASYSRQPGKFNEASTRLQNRAGRFEYSLLEAFPNKPALIEYSDICAREYRQQSSSYFNYQQIIERQRSGIRGEAVKDIGFHRLIYDTLISWDMDNRRAKLVSFDIFSDSIRAACGEIIELAAFSICELDEETLPSIRARLSDLFQTLQVMQSKSQIVGCSKALHFLLPRLVMPIDGKYTLTFLFGYRAYFRPLEAEARLFEDIFSAFHGLALRLGLSNSDESPDGWNTTVLKIIDNAIIGYLRNRKS
jgi:hypothetical protein